MKLPMIGLVSLIAGSATALTVHTIQEHQARKAQDAAFESMMYAQVIQQTNNPNADPVPPGMLPLDAMAPPTAPPESGSARPLIEYKSGIRTQKMSPIPTASLVLKRTDKLVPKTKDPIWTLELVGPTGQVIETMPALTGRAYRQNANRNQAGNKSPLPKGKYTIDRYGIASAPFNDPELGRGWWVPITPMFNTNRSALGFHQDPSWGKTNGESGTSGCIGLNSVDATVKLVNWIKHFNIQTLTVES